MTTSANQPRRAAGSGRDSRSRRGGRRLAAVLLGAALLAGCSTRSGAPGDGEQAGAAFEPITITDQRGVTHTFTEPVDRIATTIIPSPSMITAIDQSYDRIVGVNQSVISRDKGSVFATMFPQSLTNTVVSGSNFVPNVETIVSLDPDVVIQWADQGDDATFIDPIENAGYPVIGLQYGTQADLETWIDIFGTLLGQQERAAQLLAMMHADIAAVQAYAARQADSPRTLFLRGDGSGAYQAGYNSAEAYMTTWMTSGGATNPAAGIAYSATATVGPEPILDWNPDVVFVSSMTTLTVQDVLNDPALATLPAVREHRVYAVPSGGFWWDPPSAESGLMFQWAAEVLRPDDQAFDLRSAMKEEYAFLYGHQLSDADIDAILKMDQNTGSAGYAETFGS